MENVLPVSEPDDTTPVSPSWLNDDFELFENISRIANADPCSAFTRVDVMPKSPTFSPRRSGLKALLRKATPVFTPSSTSQNSFSPSPEGEPTTVSHPIIQKKVDLKQITLSSKKAIPPQDAEVIISSSFLKSINEACDVIQAMPLEKLINCFEGQITSITQLLTARSNYQDSLSKSHSKQQRHQKSQQQKQRSCLSASRSSVPAQSTNANETVHDDVDSRNGFDGFVEQAPTLPTVEIIARSKPKEPKFEADTGEGNVFLPLSSYQSKWGMPCHTFIVT